LKSLADSNLPSNLILNKFSVRIEIHLHDKEVSFLLLLIDLDIAGTKQANDVFRAVNARNFHLERNSHKNGLIDGCWLVDPSGISKRKLRRLGNDRKCDRLIEL